MARLVDSLLRLDTAARRIGTRSPSGQALHDALAQLRRDLAPVALRQLVEERRYDPKADLMEILGLAEDAGLAWPDMRDAINHFHERRPGVGA